MRISLLISAVHCVLVLATPSAGAQCTATCSQSVDNATVDPFGGMVNGPACDTNYLRAYDLVGECGLPPGETMTFTGVVFGTEWVRASDATGSQTAVITFYSWNSAAPLRYAFFTIVLQEYVEIHDAPTPTLHCLTFPWPRQVSLAAGEHLVVELSISPSSPQAQTLITGGNTAGASRHWYFSSQLCGTPEPKSGPGLGFNELIFDLIGQRTGPIGTNYCGPANVNSSGQAAELSAYGNLTARLNLVTLTASHLPPSQFAYFLNSDAQGFVPFPPGSSGNLCLGGGIGRHVKQAGLSGLIGGFAIDVNLERLPRPGGAHSVVAGETWNFQCWFRDNQGGPTSNFTDGIEIVFN
jgi:hypothetical protein